MRKVSVKHNAQILIGDYQFAEMIKGELLSLIRTTSPYANPIPTVVTGWNWEPNNDKFNNLKDCIKNAVETTFKPCLRVDGGMAPLVCEDFWANIYEKGDHIEPHNHRPSAYSFVYFVKAKWYHAPFVFTDSGKRIRPKEGRWVAFPSYLDHHVLKHRYKDTRITVSGNFRILQ